MNTYLRNITITCLLLAAVSVAFGREGVKLFSIGNIFHGIPLLPGQEYPVAVHVVLSPSRMTPL